jgi:hypothetical protein
MAGDVRRPHVCGADLGNASSFRVDNHSLKLLMAGAPPWPFSPQCRWHEVFTALPKSRQHIKSREAGLE